jgi:hypothetical protein
MTAPFATRLQRLGRHAWVHKGARTLLAVAPGLSWFGSTGEPRGVMVAFAALCLSVPCGDRSFRPVHLAGCAVVSGLLLPAAVWRQSHPALYVPVVAAAGGAHGLASRSAILPPRVPTWALLSLRYARCELHGEAWSTVVTAALLVAPAALWVYVACFCLWPWRGEEAGGRAASTSAPGLSVPVHAACAALSMASAAAATLAFHLPHPNWAIWSALTVIRPARAVSLRRAAERLAGAVIGCAVGLRAVLALGEAPFVLAALTVVVVVLIVAFEPYTLAVAIRSALAPRAALALHGDAMATGQARFVCMVIGAAIGTTFMLLLSRDWVASLSERLLKRGGWAQIRGHDPNPSAHLSCSPMAFPHGYVAAGDTVVS